MGSLRPYHAEKVKAEVTRIAEAVWFLCGMVDDFSLLLENTDDPFETSFAEARFLVEWEIINDARKRLAELLDHGETDLLDCDDAGERRGLRELWKCIECIPRERTTPVLDGADQELLLNWYRSEKQFGFWSTGEEFDSNVKTLYGLTRSAESPAEAEEMSIEAEIESSLPSGMAVHTRKAIKMILRDIKYDIVYRETNVSPSHCGKLKSQYIKPVLDRRETLQQ